MKSRRTSVIFGVAMGMVSMAGLVSAQTPVPARPNAPVAPIQAAPAPVAPAAGALTPQVLGEMLRSATTFHELVRSMNLNQSLGPDQHYIGSDGRVHHSVERTAETIGAGAGAGAAIGAMTHSQNGVLIGALVGGAGGLILDEILKHREEARQHSAYGPFAPPAAIQPGFRERDHDQDEWHRLGEPQQRAY